MAATFVAAANDPASGDGEVPSRSVSKPAGATLGVFFVTFWNFTGAITAPSGMVLRSNNTNGTERTATYLKHVGADSTGTDYTFSWSGAQWSDLKACFFSGVDDALDLSTVPFNTANATGTGFATTTVTTVAGAALVWSGNTEDYSGSPSHTPPASYSETGDTLGSAAAYRISPADGSQSASGATCSESVTKIAVLLAVAPADTGGVTVEADVTRTATAAITAAAQSVKDTASTSSMNAAVAAEAVASRPANGELAGTAVLTAAADITTPAASAVDLGAATTAAAASAKPASAAVAVTAGTTADATGTRPTGAVAAITASTTVAAEASRGSDASLTVTVGTTAAADTAKPAGGSVTVTAGITAAAVTGAAPVAAEASLIATATGAVAADREAVAVVAVAAAATLSAAAGLDRVASTEPTFTAGVSGALAKTTAVSAAVAAAATVMAAVTVLPPTTRGHLMLFARTSPGAMSILDRGAPGARFLDRRQSDMNGGDA